MKDKITAFILAGGKSQRMGTDKGLLPLAGKPFVSHICEAVKSIVGENIVIVSSNADYDFLGYKRIEDLVSDKGPVGGIYTALQYSRAKLNFILSVDAPLVADLECFEFPAVDPVAHSVFVYADDVGELLHKEHAAGWPRVARDPHEQFTDTGTCHARNDSTACGGCVLVSRAVATCGRCEPV